MRGGHHPHTLDKALRIAVQDIADPTIGTAAESARGVDFAELVDLN